MINNFILGMKPPSSAHYKQICWCIGDDLAALNKYGAFYEDKTSISAFCIIDAERYSINCYMDESE